MLIFCRSSLFSIFFIGALFAFFENKISTHSAITASLQLNKSASVSSLPSGETFYYTIQYRCASLTDDCLGTVITDPLPAAVEFVSVSGSIHTTNESYNSGTHTVTFDFVDPLIAGTSGQVQIEVRFPNGTTPNGTIASNTATISASNATSVSSTANVTATAQNRLVTYKYYNGGVLDEVTGYGIQICNNTENGHPIESGTLNPTNLTIVDPLPVGSVYHSSNFGGVYNAGTHTITWTIADIPLGECRWPQVFVVYPSSSFSLGQVVTNNATVTYTPVGESSISTPVSVDLTIDVPKIGGYLDKDANDHTVNPGQTWVHYDVKFSNWSNVEIDGFYLEDTIPDYINVRRIDIGEFYANGPYTNLEKTVRYTTNLNSTLTHMPGSPFLIHENPTFYRGDLGLAANEYITKIRWDFGPDPMPISSGVNSINSIKIYFDVDASAPPGPLTNCFEAGGSSDVFSVDGGDPCDVITVGSLSSSFIPGTRKDYESPECGGCWQYNIAGDWINAGDTVGMRVRLRSASASGIDIPNPSIIDLLPVGMEYIPGSWVYDENGTGISSPVFTETPNYNNTGRNRLKWDWPGVNFPSNNAVFVSFDVRITMDAPVGEDGLTNRYIITPYGNEGCSTSGLGGLFTDTEDWDGDGNTTEEFCSGLVDLDIIALPALESEKLVKGQLDMDWTKYPDVGYTVPGGLADYQLIVRNKGNVPLDSVIVIDVLPFVGDEGVINLNARDSRWRPNLVGSVSAPSGVTVYYSTEGNPCRSAEGILPSGPPSCNAANWSITPPADITTVQSLKFDFGAIILNANDSLILEWPMRAPVNALATIGVQPDSTAWNSFGYIGQRVDNSEYLLPSEPIKVGISMNTSVPAVIGDYVWIDNNQNGIQNGGEPGYDGMRVELYEDNGDGIADPTVDNYVNFTVTANGGFYLFPYLPAGDYFLVFYKPAPFGVTTANAGGNDALDSDGTLSNYNGFTIAITPVSNLSGTEYDLDLDLGIYPNGLAAIGNYVWADSNGDGVQNEPSSNGVNGVTVNLYNNSNPSTIFATTITSNDFNGNSGYYLFDQLSPGNYFVEFVLPASTTFANRGSTGSSDPLDSDVNISNGRTEVFSLTGNNYDNTWDAGLILSGTEVCGNGVDDDLDGQIDEGCVEICDDGIDNDGDGFIDEFCVEDCDHIYDENNILENSENDWTYSGTEVLAGDSYQYDSIRTGLFPGKSIGGSLLAWDGSTDLFWYYDPLNNSGNPEGDYFLGAQNGNVCLIDTSSAFGLCGFEVCLSSASDGNYWIFVESIPNLDTQTDRKLLGREYRSVSGPAIWNWEEICITIHPDSIPANSIGIVVSVLPTGTPKLPVYFDDVSITPATGSTCLEDCFNPFACDSTVIMAASTSEHVPSQVYNLNTTVTPFALDEVGNASGYNVNALGYRNQDDFIYGIKLISNELIKVDKDGSQINLGAISGLDVPGDLNSVYDAGDVFPDGYLYVHEVYNHAEIYQIDVTSTPPNLVQTHILSQNIALSDFAYNANDNKVYGVGEAGEKFMIDPVTWNVSTVGTNAAPASYGAAYTSNSGRVYVYRNNPGALYHVDFGVNGTGTGAMTQVATGPNVIFNDGASCRGDIYIPEICDNGIDDDEDGLADCNDPDCVDCTDTCTDTDGDGIGDFCDLDDDNDGIPDLVESRCDENILSIGTWDHNSIPYQQMTIWNPGVIASGDNEMPGAGISVIENSTTLEITGIDQNSLAGAMSNNDYLEYGFTTQSGINTLYAMEFIYTKNDFAPANEYGYQISIIYSSNNFLSSEFLIENHEVSDFVDGSQQNIRISPSNKFAFFEANQNYKIRIYFYSKTTPGIARFDDFGIQSGQCQWSLDVDNDGISNHLDLDSDNDGIFDAHEAGHTQNVGADGRIVGATTGSGTNGLFNALETAVDNDILNYGIADSENSNDGIYDPYELDSDGDGCFDAKEENVVDADENGIAGSGTPTVDGNGLVNGNSYSNPPNDLWQDHTRSNCLSISGSIFEDINFGGGDGRSYMEANISAQASGWSANAIRVPNARVELYDNSGAFVTAVLSAANGEYLFTDLASGTYSVRVVNGTVSSNRASNSTGETIVPVQTFRTDNVTDVINEVGGANPTVGDAASNTTNANFSTLNTASTVAQSVTTITLSGSDRSDIDFGYNFDVVVNTNDIGQGSLRQFILNSNELDNTNLDQEDNPTNGVSFPKDPEWETSIFMIPGGGVHTIYPLSSLPSIEDPKTHVSAYTQSGSAQGPIASRTINVELDGNGNNYDGLTIYSSDVQISGLAINSFRKGIYSNRTNAVNNFIWGNYIGTEANGTTSATNSGSGIDYRNIINSAIGTNGDNVNDANEGNVISSSYYGIDTRGGNNLTIAGNYIGLDKTGTVDLGHRFVGVYLGDARGPNYIGFRDDLTNTNAAHFRNVISGNGNDAVRISSSDDQVVAGNYLGTDVTGTIAIENENYGIQLQGVLNNNIIGTNSNGDDDIKERNIISGNGTGLRFIGSSTGSGNIVSGNFIGTDVTGNNALPNQNNGIDLEGNLSGTIIGTNGDNVNDAVEGNVISGNAEDGIRLGNNNTTIAGNNIGLGYDNTTVVGNGKRGILLPGTASNNIIGYSPSMANSNELIVGNKIMYNDDSGIGLSGTGTQNRISRNQLANNSGLGIDLDYDLVSPNDNGDGDTGPNNMLNFPVFESAEVIGNNLVISGFAPAGAEIEFFIADAGPNPNPLPAGYTSSFGEGAVYLFSLTEGSGPDTDATTGNYTDDGTGATSTKTQNRFEVSIDTAGFNLNNGINITATATDNNDNTSEFSGWTSVEFIEVCDDGIDNDGDGLTDCYDCEDCFNSTGCDDNDNDGIGDICDLDDDNDGIPDKDEIASCSATGGVIENNFYFDDFGAGTDIVSSPYVQLCYEDGTNPCNLPSGVSWGEVIDDGEYSIADNPKKTTFFSGWTTDGDHTGDLNGRMLIVNANIDPDTFYIRPINGFIKNAPVTGSFWVRNTILPGNDFLKPSITASISDADGNILGSINTGDIPEDLTWYQYTISANAGDNDIVYLILENNGPGGYGNDLTIDDISFSQFLCDCDNDGVANHLDLDSDNDGIYDVDEAGHNAVDANDDGIIDNANSLSGPNGLFDALETVAENGIINYSIADSEATPDGTYDICELDSDGDGCFDAEEEEVADSENDGTAGTGIPTVDVNGLVTSITYASPPNNIWQNPIIGPCLPEVCDDGIDNNANGLTDCDDEECITSPTINLSQNTACVNETIIISSSDIGAGTTYNWNFGMNASPATASGIGPHNVSYTSCGSKTISLTVQKNGCSITVDSIVQIIDNTDPVWDTNPQDLILECNSSKDFSDSISLWLASNGYGIVSDNCSSFRITNNYTGLTADCGSTASTTVDFTAIDSCGNSAIGTANIQILDTQAPEISSVNDITVDCDNISAPPSPTIIDSCDVSPAMAYQEVRIQHPNANWKLTGSCSLLYEVTSGIYDDKGTLSTADDEMNFVLTIIGQNTGSGWSATANGTPLSGSYYQSYQITALVSGGPLLSFTVVDDNDASCTISVVIDASDF